MASVALRVVWKQRLREKEAKIGAEVCGFFFFSLRVFLFRFVSLVLVFCCVFFHGRTSFGGGGGGGVGATRTTTCACASSLLVAANPKAVTASRIV